MATRFARAPEIETNVLGLDVHRASSWIFNCYVIDSGGGATVLVDPGLPVTAAAALDLVRGRGGTADHAVSTHGHCDHVGGMPYLHNHAGTQNHLPGRCADYLAGEEPRVFGARAAAGFVPMYREQPFTLRSAKQFVGAGRRIGFARGGPMRFAPPIASFLADGDPVPGAPGWYVVVADGHSDCSIAYHHPESATLLSGDAVVSLDGRAWFNPEWVDEGACRRTEERLRALDVEHLLPGHGRPVHGDVWGRAIPFGRPPPGRGLLLRCSRRFGEWPG